MRQSVTNLAINSAQVCAITRKYMKQYMPPATNIKAKTIFIVANYSTNAEIHCGLSLSKIWPRHPILLKD
jgi:hypothetical protein